MTVLKARPGPTRLIAKTTKLTFGQDIQGIRINTEAMDAITTEAGDNIITDLINVIIPTFRMKAKNVKILIAKI